jgi:GH18 family chitinase
MPSGYENERSVTEKTVFARSLQIAGVMVFGLHTEDRTGSCGRGKYPLINAIKSVLFNGTTSSNAKRSSSLIIRKNKNELNKTT